MKNDVQHLAPKELVQLARVLQSMMTILNARLFTLLGLLMSFALFGWAAYKSEYWPAICACAFAILVFWPCVRMDARKLQNQPGVQNEEKTV